MNFSVIKVSMKKILRKTELLAPAKNKIAAFAAINSGADAVYIGAPAFGARVAASNSFEDIQEIVNFAHKFNVKVHVTVNTILKDEELPEAVKLIEKLYEIGVDAIIIQDAGLMKLAVENKLPPIVLHASTQCNNRSLEKIKFLEEVGFSRAVLARELSLEQIKNICQNTDIEIETFVHGALCVSYSGQCYMSCSIGGRSANRGECAQPCRKKYSLVDDKGNFIARDKHLLSLKDFNASKYLENLVNAGVKSFKIEGRLKDVNYVRNVTAFYRQELDKFSGKTSSGKVFLDFEPDLKKSFNRGFTSYFLEKREKCFNFNSPKMKGEKVGKIVKSAEGWIEFEKNSVQLSVQDGICYFEEDELKGCLVNKIVGNKVYLNKKIIIPIGSVVFRNYDVTFDNLLTNSKTKRRLGVTFEYSDKHLKATDEDNNSVTLEVKFDELPKNPEKQKNNFISQLKKVGDSDFYVSDIKINGDIPFMPVSEINKMRREILEKLIAERLKNYKRDIQKPMQYARYIKPEGDYRENAYNKEAELFYKNCGCNLIEPAFESLSKTDGKELMRTKHCLKYAFDMCKSPKTLYLIDDKGKKYKLKFDCSNCEMVVLNGV